MAELRKSRRSLNNILGWRPLAWGGLFSLFLVTSGMGLVWLRDCNERLLRGNAVLRRQIETQHKFNQEIEAQFQSLTRPDVLYERARALGLVQPEPAQVVKVPLVPRDAPLPESPTAHLAGRLPAGREGGTR